MIYDAADRLLEQVTQSRRSRGEVYETSLCRIVHFAHLESEAGNSEPPGGRIATRNRPRQGERDASRWTRTCVVDSFAAGRAREPR